MQMLIVLHAKNSASYTWYYSPLAGKPECTLSLHSTNASHIWLVTNATMSSLRPLVTAFPSLLCSLPSCVVEGTTVSTRTSLSNFKKAQFPFKACSRTDYPLLAGFLRVQLVYSFCFGFVFIFTLLQHCCCRSREMGRMPAGKFWGPSFVLSPLFLPNKHKLKHTMDCHKN